MVQLIEIRTAEKAKDRRYHNGCPSEKEKYCFFIFMDYFIGLTVRSMKSISSCDKPYFL